MAEAIVWSGVPNELLVKLSDLKKNELPSSEFSSEDGAGTLRAIACLQ